MLTDSTLLPLGCRVARLILQANLHVTPVGDSLLDYVAVLASLDGAVPGLARTVKVISQIPSGMAGWARDHNISLDPPTSRRLPNGEVEVTALVLADALFRVVAVIGEHRFDDRIVETELIVGIPPG
jgi:hypothetical protein